MAPASPHLWAEALPTAKVLQMLMKRACLNMGPLTSLRSSNKQRPSAPTKRKCLSKRPPIAVRVARPRQRTQRHRMKAKLSANKGDQPREGIGRNPLGGDESQTAEANASGRGTVPAMMRAHVRLVAEIKENGARWPIDGALVLISTDIVAQKEALLPVWAFGLHDRCWVFAVTHTHEPVQCGKGSRPPLRGSTEHRADIFHTVTSRKVWRRPSIICESARMHPTAQHPGWIGGAPPMTAVPGRNGQAWCETSACRSERSSPPKQSWPGTRASLLRAEGHSTTAEKTLTRTARKRSTP